MIPPHFGTESGVYKPSSFPVEKTSILVSNKLKHKHFKQLSQTPQKVGPLDDERLMVRLFKKWATATAELRVDALMNAPAATKSLTANQPHTMGGWTRDC
jgi:hypothetical protein